MFMCYMFLCVRSSLFCNVICNPIVEHYSSRSIMAQSLIFCLSAHLAEPTGAEGKTVTTE